MPDFDGTGPSGKGPLTGRNRGRCRRSSNKANNIEEASESQKKFGFGRRRNIGECRRHRDQDRERRSGG